MVTRCIEVTIGSTSSLRENKAIVSKADPWVVVKFGDVDYSTYDEATPGTRPVWNHRFSFLLPETLDDAPKEMLFTVYDKVDGAAKIIGTSKLSVAKALSSGLLEAVQPVHRKTGKLLGYIRLHVAVLVADNRAASADSGGSSEECCVMSPPSVVQASRAAGGASRSGPTSGRRQPKLSSATPPRATAASKASAAQERQRQLLRQKQQQQIELYQLQKKQQEAQQQQMQQQQMQQQMQQQQQQMQQQMGEGAMSLALFTALVQGAFGASPAPALPPAPSPEPSISAATLYALLAQSHRTNGLGQRAFQSGAHNVPPPQPPLPAVPPPPPPAAASHQFSPSPQHNTTSDLVDLLKLALLKAQGGSVSSFQPERAPHSTSERQQQNVTKAVVRPVPEHGAFTTGDCFAPTTAPTAPPPSAPSAAISQATEASSTASLAAVSPLMSMLQELLSPKGWQQQEQPQPQACVASTVATHSQQQRKQGEETADQQQQHVTLQLMPPPPPPVPRPAPTNPAKEEGTDESEIKGTKRRSFKPPPLDLSVVSEAAPPSPPSPSPSSSLSQPSPSLQWPISPSALFSPFSPMAANTPHNQSVAATWADYIVSPTTPWFRSSFAAGHGRPLPPLSTAPAPSGKEDEQCNKEEDGSLYSPTSTVQDETPQASLPSTPSAAPDSLHATLGSPPSEGAFVAYKKVQAENKEPAPAVAWSSPSSQDVEATIQRTVSAAMHRPNNGWDLQAISSLASAVLASTNPQSPPAGSSPSTVETGKRKNREEQQPVHHAAGGSGRLSKEEEILAEALSVALLGSTPKQLKEMWGREGEGTETKKARV